MRQGGSWGLAVTIGVFAACGSAQPPETATRSPPADPAPPSFRLPDGVLAREIALDLTIRPGDQRFSGVVELDVELREPARAVWLHAEKLTPREASVTVAGATRAARTVLAAPTWLGVVIDEPIPAGPVRLRVAYEGNIDRESGAAIFQGVEADRVYVQTQFQPKFARQAFPCFDEPGVKVPWRLTLRVPPGLVTAANSPIESESDGPDGMRVVRFQRTAPLPSYLVAFVVGPYDVVDGGTAGKNAVPLRFLVPRGRAGETALLREITARALVWLEEYMGLPFPYPKLDTVAIAGSMYHGGAMENAGLITSTHTSCSPPRPPTGSSSPPTTSIRTRSHTTGSGIS